MDWKEKMNRIVPASEKRLIAAWQRLDSLAKPRRSLGLLEEIAARYSAIREDEPPSVAGKGVFVFAADHGVVNEGVSAYPQEVTGLMVKNFLAGGAGINVLARCAAAEVFVVDVGMARDPGAAPGLIRRAVRHGTGNILREPAMSMEELEAALNVGIEMSESAFEKGINVVGTGDMGIGNTTAASAVFASLLPAEPARVTGRGTGLDDRGLQHKIRVIEQAVARAAVPGEEPLRTLAELGGLEIAAICGLCLGAASRRIAVMVDGFISSAGALAAMRLKPEAADYLFFSHCSVESGHRVFFEIEGIRPLMDLDLRLGEGTGAALAMQILESGVKVYNEMATFAEVGIEPGA
ncbi:MAG: nicotinate-nucleotide--dimethylbenzimidazole phosphoribosyltransferase [Desulfobacteraceae bacterium]